MSQNTTNGQGDSALDNLPVAPWTGETGGLDDIQRKHLRDKLAKQSHHDIRRTYCNAYATVMGAKNDEHAQRNSDVAAICKELLELMGERIPPVREVLWLGSYNGSGTV
jgi:hypothetical protein